MNEKMNNRKAKIDRSMAKFIFFIVHWQQRDASFNDPEDQQATNKKGHPLHRVLFQFLEIINTSLSTYKQKCYEKLRSELLIFLGWRDHFY